MSSDFELGTISEHIGQDIEYEEFSKQQLEISRKLQVSTAGLRQFDH